MTSRFSKYVFRLRVVVMSKSKNIFSIIFATAATIVLYLPTATAVTIAPQTATLCCEQEAHSSHFEKRI